MTEQAGREYYMSRKSEILALFDDHAQAWKPFIASRYGDDFANTILKEAREQHEALIPAIPYIGGDENPMTRHLVRSTTSLALYKAMKARGKTAEQAGKIIYNAVVERVSHLPVSTSKALSPEDIVSKREQARKSQERLYPGDWVWEFVEGDGVEFDYGYDFLECGTQKLYHAQEADEFLPFYCFLDFVTSKASGWGLARSMTLAEGYEKCDFRFKRGAQTEQEWPPPFLEGQKELNEQV
ncbi:MAG: L-2-amino-thiazoline-4-carboxylic acid hydrolase [Anaerolineae bacterium]|nr:L-2-amino-thiazoline-4-carboxylic acid hydrolase [Anaerolineae bacterium]